MRKRPFLLYFCAFLFLIFPIELLIRHYRGAVIVPVEWVLNGLLPFALLFGLLRVNKFGWYTLLTLITLWGIQDLVLYYQNKGMSLISTVMHLIIYAISITYFINPRIRHLYFDPKLRWWRTKRRYETFLPLFFKHNAEWQYPVMRNISEGGFFLETPHLIEVGETIQFNIPLPVPLNVSVIQGEGIIRWISTHPAHHGMGVQFVNSPPDQLEAVHSFVRRQL